MGGFEFVLCLSKEKLLNTWACHPVWRGERNKVGNINKLVAI
jgi:hypothetical protein